MGKFIVRVILFTVILVALLAAGEAGVRSLPNLYRAKNDMITHNGDKISTLVLGHSQTFYGIDASILGDSTYNLAGVSQNLDLDAALLEKFAPRLTNLRRVIVPVTYTTLFEPQMEDTDEWWRLIKYQLYYHLGGHSSLSRYGAEVFNISGYAGQLGVLLHMRKPQLTADSLGHGTGYELGNKYPGWEQTAETFAEAHTASLRPSRFKHNIGRLERIQELCDSLGASLVLITPPVWHEYARRLDAGRWQQTVNVIDSLRRARGIEWYDMSRDPRFGDNDFFDADHLTSDAGAKKFSTILRDTLRHRKHY